MGKPMQAINISAAITAFDNTKVTGGTLLSGTIIKLVTNHAKTPYSKPVIILFFPSQFILG